MRTILAFCLAAVCAASAAAESAPLEAARSERAPLPPRGGFAVQTPGHIGFTTGNEFDAFVLRGEVTVNCSDPRGGSDHAWLRCSDEVLDPAEFVRFQGPDGVDADRVTLEAVWENGKVRKKSERWDPETARSAGRFNLWIATLLQRPLLDYGKNQVRWVLEKDGKPVREGTFTAEVRRGGVRECRYRRHYWSSDPSDCRAGSSRICERYFRDENYCQ